MRFITQTKPYQLKNYRFMLVASVLLISILGVLVVGSASPERQNSQILGVVLGVIAMVVVSLIDYSWVLNFYWFFYIINVVLLVATELFGVTVNNARRWLNLGFVQFQTSDLSKIILILFYAKFFSEHRDDLNTPRTIITSVLLLIPTLILLLRQPNLSTTICISLVFCAIYYSAGLSYKFIGTVLAIVIPAAVIFLSIVVQPNQPFLRDYQQTRILAWLNPEEYASDEAYQQMNSIMAIGSGQLTGKGLNNNTTTSVKNGNYISEPQTDFIFAIVGEELGFVGCCIVIGLLLLIVIQCILVGIKAQDLAGQIVCCGVAALIGFQSFINIGVATGVLPNTGIPLPFVSYGLTSLVCMYASIGFVLNIGLQPKKYQ